MSEIDPRWSKEKANQWWTEKGWVCGCNFLPSTSVNFLDMWSEDTFDKDTIAKELGWASEIGLNAVRVNLHFLVWKFDRDGLIDRMHWFLETTSRLGIYTVFVPFDDCEFGGENPVFGPQPEPIEGVHNSRAVASPGRKTVMDRSQWSQLEAFIRDVVKTFRNDERILFWDLYNEPGNRMIFMREGIKEYDEKLLENSRDLLRRTFEWARDEHPSQPVTVGVWRTPPVGEIEDPYKNEIDQIALELSDIVTFHAYCDRAHAVRYIDYLEQSGRPLLTTEWMARAVGSKISDQLPLYFERNIGCFNWGLVKGKTQTTLPWPEPLIVQHGANIERDIWFHDIFWPDGTPYDQQEIELVKKFTSSSKTRSATE